MDPLFRICLSLLPEYYIKKCSTDEFEKKNNNKQTRKDFEKKILGGPTQYFNVVFAPGSIRLC